jgi:hypothetical protein
MALYSFQPNYKNIKVAATFLQYFYELDIFNMSKDDILDVFPKNPPVIVNIMIKLIEMGYNREQIYNKLKPMLINWLNPRNRSLLFDNKKYEVQDKYIVQTFEMISKYLYIKYPN